MRKQLTSASKTHSRHKINFKFFTFISIFGYSKNNLKQTLSVVISNLELIDREKKKKNRGSGVTCIADLRGWDYVGDG